MARDNFERSLTLVLEHEGGWADHPSDPGGATMKGVTKATYEAWLGREVTKAELRAIPDKHLQAIYRQSYWDKVRGDDLPIGVDYAVFDFGVNSGPSRASKFLQRTVGAVADGIIGPATLRLVNAIEPSVIISRLCDSRLAWLKGLKHWPTFGKGWERRASEVKADGVAMTSRLSGSDPTAPEASGGTQVPENPERPSTARPGGLWAAFLRLLFPNRERN